MMHSGDALNDAFCCDSLMVWPAHQLRKRFVGLRMS
jgi:hypothetical protein